MTAANPAAGAQPHALPIVLNLHRSPNCTPGRAGHPIRYFIRHNTETVSPGNAPSLAWFLDPASARSVHHLVARDGVRYDLVQRVDTAWHCGEAAWGADHGDVTLPDGQEVAVLNLRSIGMEFESSSTGLYVGDGYTDEQLWTGAYTEACTRLSYGGIGPDALVCLDHRQIAQPPGRRADPSHFPTAFYQDRVAAWMRWLAGVPAAERPRYFR